MTVLRSMTRCLWLCKDTKFKAIHNLVHQRGECAGVVYDYAKILNLKQFTTGLPSAPPSACCLWLCKDTKFKAIHNSPRRRKAAGKSCLWLCKDTKFKAIHNGSWRIPVEAPVVYDYAKILNLKQFTTDTLRKIIFAIFREIENQKWWFAKFTWQKLLLQKATKAEISFIPCFFAEETVVLYAENEGSIGKNRRF